MEWTLLQTIYRVRVPAIRKIHTTPPPVQTLVDEFGIEPMLIGPWMYLLENYNPETVSAAHYLQRNLYYHPKRMMSEFERMADAGLLEATGENDPIDPVYGAPEITEAPRYRTTDKGYNLFNRIHELVKGRSSLSPVEDADLDRLMTLIARVVEATQCAPTPPAHWSVDTRLKYGLKLPQDVPPIYTLAYNTFDLWAYRDDVHIAAWREAHPDVTPRAWEAFTTLWRSEAKDAESLAKALEDHAFSAEEYAHVLNDLVARGWVVENNGDYTLTDDGKLLRQDAEDLTDKYFYKPWDVALTPDERAEVCVLMQGLIEKLEAIASQ